MPTPGLVALALLSLGQTADPYPDQVDVLAAAGAKPNIVLLLDDSGSMDDPAGSPMTCAGVVLTSRIEQLRHVLNGCANDTDGILDRWSEDVNFAFYSLNQNLISGFAAEIPVQEIDDLPTRGSTPMVGPYHAAASMIQDYVSRPEYLADTDVSCRANAIVVMSDGESNGSDQYFGDIVPPAGWECDAAPTGQCMLAYDYADPESEEPYPRGLWDAARWLSDTGVRVATSTTGGAQIDTYSIFFGSTGNETLRRAATEGNGIYRRALSGEDVDYAFNTIISAVVSNSRESFGTAAVQNDGIVSGNEVYVTSFRPAGGTGPWYGTTSRYCLVNGEDASGCFFDRTDDGDLVAAADAPTELFLAEAGLSPAEAAAAGERGGTEYLIRNPMEGVDVQSMQNPYSRNLISWNDGGYFNLANAAQSGFSPEFEMLVASRQCAGYRLGNYLFGYTSQVRSCASDHGPVDVAASVVGDTMDGSTLTLNFAIPSGPSPSKRFVFTNANDGMLHIYDGDSGSETAALIPAQLWDGVEEDDAVSTSSYWNLTRRYDEARRRFVFDGTMRLYHEDTRSEGEQMSDGLIQPEEVAYVLMGLGRGGYAYYLMNVAELLNETDPQASRPDANTPVIPLTYQTSGNFAHLRETWAAPWVGRLRRSTDNSDLTRVAVFASGHEREFDRPQADFNDLATRAVTEGQEVVHTSWEELRGEDMAKLGLDDPRGYLLALYQRVQGAGGETPMPEVDVNCEHLGDPDPSVQPWTTPPWGTSWPCPEPSGVAWGVLRKTEPEVPENFTAFFNLDEGGSGQSVYLSADNDANGMPPLGYNIHFESMNLRAGDVLVFRDEDGGELTRVGCTEEGCATETGWMRAQEVSMTYYSAGDESSVGGLWEMGEIEVGYARRVDRQYRPSFYVVNLDDWAGHTPFARMSAADQDALVIQRFTSDCGGSDSNCTDGSSEGFAALNNMTCPISAEPAVYTEGGVFRAAYVGDECGQIWRFRYQNGRWDVRRLLSLNRRADIEDGATIAGRHSKDYRKIFRKLELVVSRCTGTRAIGVYFNSGNVQTPSAVAEGGEYNARYLDDSNVVTPLNNTGRDVFGVVWDHDAAREDADRTLAELTDVTAEVSTVSTQAADPTYQGWYIQLDPSEKALRDPLVLDGVAYFRSYLPNEEATECSAANGVNRTYAMNSCTAEGEQTLESDPEHMGRMVGSTPGNIGGGFTVFVPAGGVPVVLEGLGAGTQANAKALSSGSRRSMQIRLWRTSLLD